MKKRYMTTPKRTAWLFVFLFLLAACSERDDSSIPATDVSTDPGISTVRLAMWNIRIFSDNSRDDDELQLIANVLIEYDFIAIVELRDERVLRRTESMLALMGRDYDYLMSRPVGENVKVRYAFLFDQKLVNVLEDGMVFPDPNDAFLREPYFASFRAGKFDFTAITAHVIWGDSVPPRQREVGELANVYQTVSGDERCGTGRDTAWRFQSQPRRPVGLSAADVNPDNGAPVQRAAKIAHQGYQLVRQHLFPIVLCNRIHRE